MLAGLLSFTEIRHGKNLHNLVEQDRRFIKKATDDELQSLTFSKGINKKGFKKFT